MSRRLRACALLAIVFVAGCATQTPSPPALPAFDGAAAARAVRDAGKASDTELDVRPLRDPEVEDLRQRAVQSEAAGDANAAADALDRALAIVPGDPGVLQERAEVALVLADAATAETLARRAISAGSSVGPLCRRHWETLAQVAQARGALSADGNAAAVAEARRGRDACTVAAPPRY